MPSTETLFVLLTTVCVSVLGCDDSGSDPAVDDTDSGSSTTTSGGTTVGPSTSTTSPSSTSSPSTSTTTTDTSGDTTGSGTTDSTGGTSEPPTACLETCGQDDDCAMGYVCGSDGYCELEACPDDDWCGATLGGFTNEGCAASDECTAGQCVTLGAHTFCAVPSNAGCFDATPTQVMTTEGGTVTVCVANARCGDDSTCVSSCSDDSGCFGFTPSCNQQTGACECAGDSCGAGSVCNAGQCECSSDEGCSPLKGGSVCVDGACECANDGDCVVPGFDVCIDGTCSCGNDASCAGVDIHPGGEAQCVPA